MPREALIAIAAGLASALLHLSTEWSLLGALVFALAAPMPLFAAGLGRGLNAGLVAAGVATALIAAVAGLPGAGLFAASDALPVLLLVRFALLNRPLHVDGGPEGGTEWYPPGLLLAWLSLYCAAAFAVLAVVMGSGPGGLQTGISNYVDGFRQALMAGTGDGTAANPAVERMFATLERVFPFLVVTWWIVIVVANGVAAQKFLVRTGHAMRPSPDLTATALPGWMFPAVVAAAAVALVGSGWLGFMATNIALILCVPYFLTGLAVLHAISARWNGRTAILIAVYLLLLLFGWPLLVVTGLGMVEHWAGLRQRLGGPGHGNERKE